MNVLVTGASGFIGSHLVKRLLDEGHRVRVLHRLNSDLNELEGRSYESTIGDITDLVSLQSATENIDVVYHLAGCVLHDKKHRALMEQVNVQGTKNIIEASLQNKVDRFIHLGSVVSLGTNFQKEDPPRSETASFNVQHCNWPYYETKKSSEEIVEQAYQEHGLRAVIINPSTVYGAGDFKKGSRKAQMKVAQGKLAFYPSGGVNVVHIDDVIDVLILALHKGRLGEKHIVCGDNLLIKEVFEQIAQEAKVSPPHIRISFLGGRLLGFAGDVLEVVGLKGPLNSETARLASAFHWFDNSKACKEFGLQPRSSRQAISESVAWFLKHK